MTVSRRILVSVSPGERRVALVEDGVLVEAWFDRPGLKTARVGDIQRARISARAPAMAGAFLALADGETGFLPDTASDAADAAGRAAAMAEGRVLGVRVTRAAQGGKGPRVTAKLDPAERALVGAGPAPALVTRGPSAALRLSAAWPDAAVVVDDAAEAATLRAALGDRLALSRAPAFDDAIEAGFDALAGPEAPLPGGGRLLIHPTPGLTAIDVDAGSAAGGGGNAARALNEAALAEAARQIRLRNLAGAILLDMAGMPAKRRAALVEPLRAMLTADPLRPQVLGTTGLGLIEIVRQRMHPPLHEVLGVPAAPWPASAQTLGLAALRQAAREAAARPAQGFALHAAPAVIQALRAMPGALDAYAAQAGRPLALASDAVLAPSAWQIQES